MSLTWSPFGDPFGGRNWSINIFDLNLIFICLGLLFSTLIAINAEPESNKMDLNSNTSFHTITIYHRFLWIHGLQCEGGKAGHLKSLILISCNTSYDDCESRRKMCELNENACQKTSDLSAILRTKHVTHRCLHKPYNPMAKDGGGNHDECLALEFDPLLNPHLVICSSSKIFDPVTSKFRQQRTFDYIFVARRTRSNGESPYLLMSNNISHPMEFVMTTNFKTVKMETSSQSNYTTVNRIYPNEEAQFRCTAPSFWFSVVIQMGKIDGTIMQIDSNLLRSWTESYSNLNPVQVQAMELTKFRMPKNVTSVSCIVTKLDTLIKTKMEVQLIVLDPPTNVTARSPPQSSSSSFIDQTFVVPTGTVLGCNLTGGGSDLEIREKKIKIADTLENRLVTSMTDFVKLEEMDGSKSTCKQLHDANTKEKVDYYVNLAPSSLPRIKEGKDSSSSKTILRFDGNEIDQTAISCQYGGQPMPYILWLKDGEEFMYTIGSEDIFSSSSKIMENSILKLPTTHHKKNKDPTTWSVVYTCVAVNTFGSDWQEFIIIYDDPTNQYRTASIFGLVILVLVLTIFVGGGGWYLFQKKGLKNMNFNWWPRRRPLISAPATEPAAPALAPPPPVTMADTPTTTTPVPNDGGLDYGGTNSIVNANAVTSDSLECGKMEGEPSTSSSTSTRTDIKFIRFKARYQPVYKILLEELGEELPS